MKELSKISDLAASANCLLAAGLCLLTSACNRDRSNLSSHSTPSMSPDETAIVYDSSETGGGDIYQLDLREQTVVQLTSSPEAEMHPVYSPTGKIIAFARKSGGYQHLWIMSRVGSEQAQVTFGRVTDYPDSFSADGSELLFVRTSFFGRALLAKREMFSVSLTNANHRVRRIGNYVSVAPNLSLMVSNLYDPNKQEEALWLVNHDQSERQSLGSGHSPTFSLDSGQIVFLFKKADYHYDVLVTRLSDLGQITVPFPSGYKLSPVFCRHGNAVMVRIPSSQRDGIGGVYITDLRSSKTEKVPIIRGGEL